MSCYEYIPDYNDLHAQHEAERVRQLRRYPLCAECGKRITEDFLFNIDSDLYHEECAKDNFRRHTEDYMRYD